MAAKRVLLFQPGGDIRLGDLLVEELANAKGRWNEFRAAVAFVKKSGIQHLVADLLSFLKGGTATISVGISLGGTSKEGLGLLLDHVVPAGAKVWVFHNEHASHPTFHPKLYLFKGDEQALLIVGSGNLTSGGLFSNYEAGIAMELDLDEEKDQELLEEVEELLDAWCDPTDDLARLLDQDLFDELVDSGPVPTEAKAKGDMPAEGEKTTTEDEDSPPLFGSVKVKAAPAPKKLPSTKPKLAGGGSHKGFLMTLQRTDAGSGQVTAGASRRSPEVFIPLAARDDDRDFWGWPTLFKLDPAKKGKYDRFGVKMLVKSKPTTVNMMTWPDKHDFRLRSETLRSAGDVGDIMQIERGAGGSGFDYVVDVFAAGTKEHAARLAMCTTAVRNSKKRYGYY